jgi:hypothetical protein
MYFMEAHLGDTSNLRSVYIHWTNRGIPYMRNDAFKRSLLDYLETLKGLRVLVLSGDYGEDFVQHIKQFLAARVIAG